VNLAESLAELRQTLVDDLVVVCQRSLAPPPRLTAGLYGQFVLANGRASVTIPVGKWIVRAIPAHPWRSQEVAYWKIEGACQTRRARRSVARVVRDLFVADVRWPWRATWEDRWSLTIAPHGSDRPLYVALGVAFDEMCLDADQDQVLLWARRFERVRHFE
jgi:hypothetical protein